jgi:hypothetical protein
LPRSEVSELDLDGSGNVDASGDVSLVSNDEPPGDLPDGQISSPANFTLSSPF